MFIFFLGKKKKRETKHPLTNPNKNSQRIKRFVDVQFNLRIENIWTYKILNKHIFIKIFNALLTVTQEWILGLLYVPSLPRGGGQRYARADIGWLRPLK